MVFPVTQYLGLFGLEPSLPKVYAASRQRLRNLKALPSQSSFSATWEYPAPCCPKRGDSATRGMIWCLKTFFLGGKRHWILLGTFTHVKTKIFWQGFCYGNWFNSEHGKGIPYSTSLTSWTSPVTTLFRTGWSGLGMRCDSTPDDWFTANEAQKLLGGPWTSIQILKARELGLLHSFATSLWKIAGKRFTKAGE